MSHELPDGQLIPCSLIALDVVGHSALVLSLSGKRSAEVFGEIEARVRIEVERNRGTLLGWQGDGGIAVFSHEEHSDDEGMARLALRTSEAILAMIPVISEQQGLRDEKKLHVRVALHSGSLIWRRATSSIHSADVNFVAHLEHALPNDVIGLSVDFHKALPPAECQACQSVGEFENHEVFIYSRDAVARQSGVAAFEQKRTKANMGGLCVDDGLVHFEFRDVHHRKLPPAEIYGRANSEILLSGITLAASFKQDDSLAALRAASRKNVKLCLLVLDPENAGSRFAVGHDSIEEAIAALQDEVQSGRIRGSSTEVRGNQVYPHYTGIMIDGNVEGTLGDPDVASSALLRVQTTVPPDVARNQHFAPVFQYQKFPLSSTMKAYVRGFRYYWQNARVMKKFI